MNQADLEISLFGGFWKVVAEIKVDQLSLIL
jgi:hypothetical protein